MTPKIDNCQVKFKFLQLMISRTNNLKQCRLEIKLVS